MLCLSITAQVGSAGRSGKLSRLGNSRVWEADLSWKLTCLGGLDGLRGCPVWDADMSGRLTCRGSGPAWKADLSGRLNCLEC